MAGVITLLDQPRTLDALGQATTALIFFYYTDGTVLAPIYNDKALTDPAANPIALAAGEIFPDIFLDPSITYRRRILYGDGSIHDVDPLPVEGAGDASTTTFTPPGTGGVTRTVQAKLVETAISVVDYGADPTGVQTNIATALNRALAQSKTIYFPPGTYNFGNVSGGAVMFDLFPYGDGITFIFENAKFICNTTDSTINTFFRLRENDNFTAHGVWQFEDTGYDPLITWKGAVCVDLASSSNAWGNVTIENISAHRVVTALQCQSASTNRVRGINVGTIISDDCYYGINFQNQGDGLTVGQLLAYQNYRPYFVYGCVDHDVNILSRNSRNTSGAINIARFTAAYKTNNIKVNYVARDMAVDITHVLIDHLDLSGGTIAGIDVTLDIESSVLYYPVRFVNYNAGVESAAASTNNVYGVTIRGICDAQARDCTVVASYASKQQIDFERSQNLRAGQLILDKFHLSYFISGAAVTWTSSGTAPAIGNGTCVYDARFEGGLAWINIRFTPGSTTTFGTGIWKFTVPHIAKVECTGSAWAFDSGTANFVGTAKMISGTGDIEIYNPNSPSAYGATQPFTWVNGDRFVASIVVPLT